MICFLMAKWNIQIILFAFMLFNRKYFIASLIYNF